MTERVMNASTGRLSTWTGTDPRDRDVEPLAEQLAEDDGASGEEPDEQ